MGGASERGGAVKTTDTVIAIVETLEEQDGARITEVADALGIANSTAYRHLSTLADRGYVLKEDSEFYPSMRFLRIGQYVRDRKKPYRLAASKVADLARKTDERAEFMVEEHGRSVFVHREVGANAVQTDSGIGKNHPLHATAAGKAILAHLPEDRIEEILEEHGLEEYTDNTITDRDVLFEELETVRERGVSYNKQEYIEGLRAVGVPVLAPDESIIGSLSVSGPTHRLKGARFQEEIPDLLLGTANELELKIPYS